MPSDGTCFYPGCASPEAKMGFCYSHHAEWHAHRAKQRGRRPLGLPDGMIASAPMRFWVKVDFEAAGGCWQWTVGRSGDGYGHFLRAKQKGVGAHRWAYEFCVGTIPPGMMLDHLCRNILCVRPEHLEIVSNRENVKRGIAAVGPGKRGRPKKRAYPLAKRGSIGTRAIAR